LSPDAPEERCAVRVVRDEVGFLFEDLDERLRVAALHRPEEGTDRGAHSTPTSAFRYRSDPIPNRRSDGHVGALLSDGRRSSKILEKKADLVSDDADRASFLRRIGETKRDMLDDARGGTLAYERALELDPESTFTIDSLIELYERGDDHQKLRELYRRRVDLATPDDQDLQVQPLLMQAADRFEKYLSQPREAIDCLREAARSSPRAERPRGARSTVRSEQMWSDLLENLRAEVTLAETLADRVRLRQRNRRPSREAARDPNAALEAYKSVLDEVPDDAERGCGDAHR